RSAQCPIWSAFGKRAAPGLSKLKAAPECPRFGGGEIRVPRQPLAAVTHITDSSFPKSASALPALAPVIRPSLDKRGYSASREDAMADYKARWNQAVILRGAPNRHNEPCRRRAFVLGARTVRFPLANPAAECRLRSVQSESAFGIGPSVRISHRTAELG